MSPNESTDTNISSCQLSYSDIKEKILNGEFKVKNKRGRSKVWHTFGKIENELGEELPDLVVCRNCFRISNFKFRTTSNLSKHKCFVRLMPIKEGVPKLQANSDFKENVANSIAEWAIENCRSYEVVKDSGFKKVVDFLLSIGEELVRYDKVNSFIPHPSTISRKVKKVYNISFEKIKAEISLFKNIGFGLTADVYNDNYLKKLYIAVTIYYINNGSLTSRVLGLKPIKGEYITLNVREILKEYDLEFDDKIIIVTNPNTDTNHENNHVLCINQLLYNALDKSMQEVKDIAELSKLCKKLVSHFEITYPDSKLISTLKSFPTYHWNKVYNLYVSIERNWTEIIKLLKQNKELINNVNLKHITSITKLLKPFQEAFEELQEDNNATIHLVYVHINRLKKICIHAETDLEIIKHLKEKLSSYLDSMVFNMLTIYHKIGLFLFPPANKLLQFSVDEKLLIKDECKRIMKCYLEDITVLNGENVMAKPAISNRNSELFSDFVQDLQNIKFVDKIANEILLYESKTVMFYDDFNILQWWHLHQHEYPLLYKVSCKILATPASCAASIKLFSIARNLISGEKTDIVSNDNTINEIIFLHSNIDKNELQKNLLQ